MDFVKMKEIQLEIERGKEMKQEKIIKLANKLYPQIKCVPNKYPDGFKVTISENTLKLLIELLDTIRGK